MQRQRHSSGRVWEDRVAYSRAIRVGNVVHVSGTTATDEAGAIVGAGDPYRQAQRCLANIGHALTALEARLGDVVRTRIYVTDIGSWEQVARAHREAFEAVRPATSLVEVARLIDPAMLVEIEAEAIVGDPDAD